MKNSRTKKLTTVGMLCSFAYVAVAVGRVPVVLLLKYDPKDVIIVIGGLIFGPLTSLAMAVIVSVVEMFTISSTGIWGCVMNMISSCSFACTTAFLYKRHRTRPGAGRRMELSGRGDDALELADCTDLYGISERGGGGAAVYGIFAFQFLKRRPERRDHFSDL